MAPKPVDRGSKKEERGSLSVRGVREKRKGRREPALLRRGKGGVGRSAAFRKEGQFRTGPRKKRVRRPLRGLFRYKRKRKGHFSKVKSRKEKLHSAAMEEKKRSCSSLPAVVGKGGKEAELVI